MCLLFVYINPSPKEGEYKLVLVNNRDETYSRPTKPAHFWDTGILGGMDVEKGREGGTWLGITKTGKIGCLLNIFQPKDSFSKDGAGRGFLVVNYLLENISGIEYGENIAKAGVYYNPYHLVVLEPNKHSYNLMYFNNNSNAGQEFDSRFQGFGNCPGDKPFKKVLKGKNELEKIINKYGKISQEKELVQELHAMMQDQEKNLPDQQLVAQGRGHPEALVKDLSSIWVSCPYVNYGTRTTTIILVDYSDRVVFRERTMKEPVTIENVEWDVSEFTFQRQSEL
ncbi:Transport and Golgi organization protein 2 [Halocaridina rubra]|uniref:Transport and Golgi organization protein 2 n=1 Tax=Halocaridina rubra TaxID=373956 RepID=A0AAN8XIG6_HALRR